MIPSWTACSLLPLSHRQPAGGDPDLSTQQAASPKRQQAARSPRQPQIPLDTANFGGESLGGGDGVAVEFGGELGLAVVAAAVENGHRDAVADEGA